MRALLAVALVLALAGVAAASTTGVAMGLTPERQAQEVAFMRSVKPNQTAEDMTSNVLAHTGEHVAYTCEISELTRPGVVVGQCGPDEEPVDEHRPHERVVDRVAADVGPGSGSVEDAQHAYALTHPPVPGR